MTVVTEADNSSRRKVENCNAGRISPLATHLSYDVLRVSCVQSEGVRERVNTEAGCVTLILITAS